MGELDGEGVTEGVAPVDSVLVGVAESDCEGVPEGVGESVLDALGAVGEGEVEGDPDSVGDGVLEGVDKQPTTSVNASTASVRMAYGEEQGGAGAQGGASQDLAQPLGTLARTENNLLALQVEHHQLALHSAASLVAAARGCSGRS